MYEFYRKPMSNVVSIPAESALSKGVKLSTHRQEVLRILRNTSVDLPWSVKCGLLSDFSWRMKVSGYGEGFRAKVLAEGVTGYLKKMLISENKNVPFNRSKGEILRAKKGRRKTPWFRQRGTEYSSVLFVP